ncbi:MAG: tyrosine-type recombinase/integrase [Elusimicrobia bacterium]|nr:tyrosine-type recombinase/integrase [Elusimicrobiota bacterium]
MTLLAPLLESFFTDRLYKQLGSSPNTVAGYRDAFRLLLRFAHTHLGKAPSDLLLADIDAVFVGAFLSHLEVDRHNKPQSRNVRLSAIHSFFDYVAFLEPAHSGLIQRVLAIPQKRCDRNLVDFLTPEEEEALLKAPDQSTWLGQRDYTLLFAGVETGLRVSELIRLCSEQMVLGTGPHVRCRGKGRKERCVPLRRDAADVLKKWVEEQGGHPSEALFQKRGGGLLTRDAVERIVTKHVAKASEACPSLKEKRVSPHVLRHTYAMSLRRSGESIQTIALSMGHESVETAYIYMRSDLSATEKALARLAPIGRTFRRYKPGDRLMGFLNGL